MFSYYPGWYAIFQMAIISLSLSFAMNQEALGGAKLAPSSALVVAGIAFGLWLLTFILQGIGLQKQSKKAGLSKPWLAFVPFAGTWYIGKLASYRAWRYAHRQRDAK